MGSWVETDDVNEWTVLYTDKYEEWFDGLDEDEQEDVAAVVLNLKRLGPHLHRPYADTLRESKHSNMRELRIQHRGHPYRVLYAFDPERRGVLLVGGEKTGQDERRWYAEKIREADRLFDQHLREMSS